LGGDGLDGGVVGQCQHDADAADQALGRGVSPGDGLEHGPLTGLAQDGEMMEKKKVKKKKKYALQRHTKKQKNKKKREKQTD